MKNIAEARDEVHRHVKDLLRVVDREEPLSATHVETVLWSGVLLLGGAMMALFFARQAARWPAGTQYELRGLTYEVEGGETVEVGTKFAKIAIWRPVGRVVGRVRLPRDLPMTRALGLPGNFTLPLITLVAKFAAMMAFLPTRQILRDLLGWAPAPRSVLRMVDAIGKEARPFLEQAVVPEDDTDVLLITVDGKGAPTISSGEYGKRAQPHKKGRVGHAKKSGSPKKRRGPGKKSKNAKMAAVGVICTLRYDAHGRPRPVNKRIYATFASYRAVFVWLKQEAVRRGLGTEKFCKVQFVADGADVLWDLQQEFFPTAEPCLDWMHAVEKLWSSGKAINRGSRTKRAPLEVWVHAQRTLLRQGKLEDVLATLQSALDTTSATGPGNNYRRKVLSDTINYFTKNKVRMRYDRLRRQKLVIGSGLIEGTVRHLVGMRLDGPGMRWGKARAEAVLHLRCVVLNGLWNDFETYLASREGLCLAAQPIATVTHDAVKQAA